MEALELRHAPIPNNHSRPQNVYRGLGRPGSHRRPRPGCRTLGRLLRAFGPQSVQRRRLWTACKGWEEIGNWIASRLPSSVEEGRAERSEAGVVLFNKISLLINTTPALRATPPRLRRGAFPL